MLVVVVAAATASAAFAAFPYGSGGPAYHTTLGQVPNDLSGDDNLFKYAATPEAGSPWTGSSLELNGVRGASVVDSSTSVNTAWMATTGRPDVLISVLDSGIKWNDAGAMSDLRRKIALNKGELPLPNGCPQYDCNNDNVFNVDDYAGDPAVNLSDPRRVGPPGVMTPQDLLIAFSDGSDADGNGFADDIAGWDFLDNDNDAFDDVQYGHGTGEAEGSTAEADNGRNAGSCPNCMVMPLRVGDSFIADTSNFAQAVIYGVDRGSYVIQEALGSLNQTQLGRQAVEYAYDHGTAVIASAADEAAQHHNWPSNYPHTIVVNSVTQYDTVLTPNFSYLQFNGCTNFSTHITVAIPSTSCSSDATGVGAGLAGLIYSAALNAIDNNDLGPHPTCERANGDPCPLSANEVRQIMVTGDVNNITEVDDVNFATQPETSCTPVPAPGCTDKNRLFANATVNRPTPSPLATTKSYPARKGYDEYYGYGRVNMQKATSSVELAAMPPEVEITSPDWYTQVDPTQSTAAIQAQLYARGETYTCRVEVAPGSEPNNGLTTDLPPGDFKLVQSSWCDGSARTGNFDGVVANLDLNDLKSRFPVNAGTFNGPEPVPGPPNFNGRPNHEPYGFVVRIRAESFQNSSLLHGQDRRNFFLHRDSDLLPGFPKYLPSDGESSPALADLDGDNRNDLVIATSDGIVHAMKRDGTELPGWPVHSDALPLHTGGNGFTSAEVDEDASYGAILASTSVADLDRDGELEVIAVDWRGKLYVWEGDGSLRFKREADINFSGKPLSPFVNVRQGHRYRTQHGFIGSPVAADLDGNGGNLEIIAAAMDRHVYAWDSNGSTVPGYPVMVIDKSKLTAINSTTHAPTFASGIGGDWNQGAIVDTPAVGDLTGDGKPEIVVGTNEEYEPSSDGGLAVGNLNTASLAVLAQSGILEFANSRVFAIKPGGDPGGPSVGGPNPYVSGWPKKMVLLKKELLPVVGEGVTGSPVIGTVNCAVNGGNGPKVGALSAAGPAYLFNPDGSSCYGQSPDVNLVQQDNAMGTDFAASGTRTDTPSIPAVGHPAFANFAGGTSFLVPAAGAIRALDLTVNEYQGGQDFITAYDPTTGQHRPGFPSPVNDLQFLTGPSVGDLDGLPGEEMIGGTASLELYGMNSAGLPYAPTRWPKFTGDWTVANPVMGSLGTDDTDPAARKVVVAVTRSGTLFAYNTDAPSCSASSWPRFHHDNASSGDARRDAAWPGKPYDGGVSGTTVTFKAPGDDLLCGTANHYEVVTSDVPITGKNFSQQTPVGGAPAPAAPGTQQSVNIPPSAKTYMAIRAVDEQGNVGRPFVVTVNYPRVGSATPMRIPFEIQYNECTSPNTTHVSPLNLPSCTPQVRSSTLLTTSSIGRGAGNATIKVLAGNPNTPADEADVSVTAGITDVRLASGGDYPGQLILSSLVRITDTANGAGGNETGTLQDHQLAIPFPCTATSNPTLGSRCNLSTTLDTLVPGYVKEGKRALVSTLSFSVLDQGLDGDVDPTSDPVGLGCPPTCGSGDEGTYLRQGVFAP